MPDSQFLSVEQREAMDCFSIRRSWDLLYASHAEADRRLAKADNELAEAYHAQEVVLKANAELREQLAALRNSVLNQAGDDACWILDPEHAQLPPKEEFLKSCERFHAQRTAQDGTLSGCMTIAQLEQQLAAKDAEIARLSESLDCANINYDRINALCLDREQENEQLRALLSTPETENFDKAVPLEAAHQVERWGAEHDAGKNPEDWFWLVGYLAGKALSSCKSGNLEKAKHHCVSTAAVLRNWHAHVRSGSSVMRPGISEEKALAATPPANPLCLRCDQPAPCDCGIAVETPPAKEGK